MIILSILGIALSIVIAEHSSRTPETKKRSSGLITNSNNGTSQSSFPLRSRERKLKYQPTKSENRMREYSSGELVSMAEEDHGKGEYNNALILYKLALIKEPENRAIERAISLLEVDIAWAQGAPEDPE